MLRFAYCINSWGTVPTEIFWDTALKDISDAGYEGIELIDIFDENTLKKRASAWRDYRVPGGPERIPIFFGSVNNFKDALTNRGLRVVGTYFWKQSDGEQAQFDKPSEMQKILEEAEKNAKFLHECGGEFLVLGPPFRDSYEKTSDASLKQIAKCFNALGKMTLEYDIKCTVHPHYARLIETETEIRKIMAWTDPEYVGLCPDTAHLYITGIDPCRIISEHKDRINYIHFKDAREVIKRKEWGKKRIFWELGAGKIDFPSIMKLLKNIAYDGWISIELDISENPRDSAFKNREYIDKTLLTV